MQKFHLQTPNLIPDQVHFGPCCSHAQGKLGRGANARYRAGQRKQSPNGCTQPCPFGDGCLDQMGLRNIGLELFVQRAPELFPFLRPGHGYRVGLDGHSPQVVPQVANRVFRSFQDSGQPVQDAVCRRQAVLARGVFGGRLASAQPDPKDRLRPVRQSRRLGEAGLKLVAGDRRYCGIGCVFHVAITGRGRSLVCCQVHCIEIFTSCGLRVRSMANFVSSHPVAHVQPVPKPSEVCC